MLLMQACADKLKREIEDYGCPPVFPSEAEKKDISNVCCCFFFSEFF